MTAPNNLPTLNNQTFGHPFFQIVFLFYTVNDCFPFLPDWNDKKTHLFSSCSPESIIISHYLWLRSACTHWYTRACLCGCVISVALQEHGVCTWLVFSRQLTGLWWLLPLHLRLGAMRGESKPKKRAGQDGEEMKKMSMLEVQGAERKTTGGSNGPTLERDIQKEKANKGEDRQAVCLHWIISAG